MKIIIKFIFLFISVMPIKTFSGEASTNSNPVNINVGYMSEYWIRGSFQAASVSYINANYTSGPIYLSAGYSDLRDRQGGASYNEGEAFISLYGSYNFQLMSVPTYIGLAGRG